MSPALCATCKMPNNHPITENSLSVLAFFQELCKKLHKFKNSVLQY